MSTSTAFKGVAFTMGGVLLALTLVQGTQALWNQALSASAGNIQAADFTVYLSPEGASDLPMTINGGPTTVSLSGQGSLGPLYPGKAVTTGVRITNAADASANFKVRLGAAGAATSVSFDDKLFQYLGVEAKKATAFSDCKDTGGYGALTTAGLFAEITQQNSVVFCFQVTLREDTPATLHNLASTIAIPFSAAQVG